jgi:SAM-dependent methyltransferase
MQSGLKPERSLDTQDRDTAKLRDFYEKMPYPAPLTSLDEHRELYRDPERRRALFHLIWPTERPRAGQEILIAGCGTSQAARYALREPDARITAIDISKTSLTHTLQLQEKYKLDNLILRQLSIFDVQQLEQQFDHIVCTGVLHHLADPDAGLQALRSVLNRDGAMQIMVYASYGRAGIYMMREYCRLLGMTPSKEQLQALAATLVCLPQEHPLSHLIGKIKDFQNPDALADAFLHPQDRAYTVPQIYEWLDRCGMSFGRWMEQAPYLPQCGALARTPHAVQLSELPERSQYAAAELFRGTITQHSFVAHRDDRPGERQPIHFTGQQWRNYIPIRLPWTLCVRDRVPPGSVELLLNRAHHHPDLVLAINAAQHRLFNEIDNKRTLGEIACIAGKEEARTVEFFQRLWQYDQIVFDASQAGAM